MNHPPMIFGVLGAGQLALMLEAASHNLGIRVLSLGKSAQEPALQKGKGTVGDPEKEGDLRRFFSGLTGVLFENEFVNADLLEKVGEETGVPFYPAVSVIRRLQNKLRQKDLLQELEIPTAPHLVWNPSQKTEDFLDHAAGNFPQGYVLKWAELGYDGKGTSIRPDRGQALAFCQAAREKGVAVYAEAHIPFVRELSTVVCRSSREFRSWPLVRSHQQGGVCKWVENLNTEDQKIEAQAIHWAQAVGDRLGVVGTYAVEWFQDSSGKIWVNEMAPRVHNTGHWTQDFSPTSQFENHLRAVAGMPLGSTDSTGPFLMVNLLGDRDFTPGQKFPPVPEGMVFHWYGKGQVRKGRKMGHFNVDLTKWDRESALKAVEVWEQDWIRSSITVK